MFYTVAETYDEERKQITWGINHNEAKAAEADPDFAAALQRQRDRELEYAKLQCSLENKEACLMCSG